MSDTQMITDIGRRLSQIYCLLMISCLIGSGCGRVSDDTQEAILQKDPSFKTACRAKKESEIEILKLKKEFEKDTEDIKDQIGRLKAVYDTKKSDLYARIKTIDALLEPYIESLESELRSLQADYRDKKDFLKTVEKKISEIIKLVEKKRNISFTHNEISLWNKRKESLEKEKENTLRSLNLLKEEIRIKKVELKVLKE